MTHLPYTPRESVSLRANGTMRHHASPLRADQGFYEQAPIAKKVYIDAIRRVQATFPEVEPATRSDLEWTVGEAGPCATCGTRRHHLYGWGGRPLCPSCRDAPPPHTPPARPARSFYSTPARGYPGSDDGTAWKVRPS